MNIKMTVNGDPVELDLEPRMTLVDVLRDRLDLPGAKVGCDTGQCGTCVVHVDGQCEKSCLRLAVQADGTEVTTIEGISDTDELTDLQQALWDNHAVQCGFCIPGVTMSLLALLELHPQPTNEQARSWLSGHLCRCTGYHSLVRAAVSASDRGGGGGW